MRLEMLAKVESSGKNGCPSLYVGEDGFGYVQSDEAGPDAYSAAVNLLPGERVVRIDMQVILDAADRYRAGR